MLPATTVKFYKKLEAFQLKSWLFKMYITLEVVSTDNDLYWLKVPCYCITFVSHFFRAFLISCQASDKTPSSIRKTELRRSSGVSCCLCDDKTAVPELLESSSFV